MTDIAARAHRVQLSWVADEHEPEREVRRSALGQLHEVFADDQVQVVADAPVSKSQAKALAARVERAYRSDQRALHWHTRAPLKAPLTVAVLSPAAFTRFTGDASGAIAGVTTGPNLFVVPSRVLGRPSVDDEDTLAHELVHVQDFREAGAGIEKVPTYLVEGRAYLLGDGYAKRDTPHNKDVARTLGRISAQQADAVLEHFTDARDEQQDPRVVYLGEITGALFVEFLRTRLGGRGRADAMARLSAVTEAVGHGSPYRAAFAAKFGVSLEHARAQFTQYLEKTDGDPAERLRGTLYGKRESDR